MKKDAILEKISKQLADFRNEISPKITTLLQATEKVTKTCNEIGQSWSGSFAGYHGKLYFKNFEIPKIHERFNVEWGGIHGIPNGWDSKEVEVVKQEIINRVSKNFSLDAFEHDEQELIQKAKSALHEITIEFSAFNLENHQKEKTLFEQIENFEFGKGKNYFLRILLPTSLIGRDKEASMQGIYLPTHIYYLGLAKSINDTCNSVTDFINLIDRLKRQIEQSNIRLNIKEDHMWDFVNPIWLFWQLIKQFSRLLKLAWKHKIVSLLSIALAIASFILTLLATDYTMAQSNFKSLLDWLGLT